MPIVENRGASLYFETWGQGPPLVLAHGAGGNTLVWWQQVPAFARTHRVIVFDHRCFGRSRCAKEDFRVELFPDDLIAVMDAAEVERAPVVAMSMGGWSALPAALRSPERIERVVLCGTPGGFITEGVLRAMAEVGRGARAEPGESLGGAITFSKRFREERPEMVHLYDQISALNVGFEPAMLAAVAAPEARLGPQDFTGYRTPTLMVAAEEDALFPRAVLREVADRIPGCAFVDFPGAGHSMYFEDPARFERVVREFLEQGGG